MDDLARIRLRAVGLVSSLVIAITLLSWQSVAWPHAFVSRSEPRSGATLGESPDQVRIWFDGPIESLFADIKVENGDKRRVDKEDGHVNRDNNKLLEVALPPLPRGRYRVLWSVVARDGHRRDGNFSFLIK
jgi:methionine-rich copper-binding protein CopC